MTLSGVWLIEVENAAAQGYCDGFRPVAHLKLFQNVLHVHLDRILGDGKLCADFLIALACRHFPEHLQFTCAQFL